MIEQTTIEKAAYAMQSAYKSEPKMVDAINKVINQSEDFKKIPYNVLQGMWLSIDAYIDMNT
jgi:hypothetical protein